MMKIKNNQKLLYALEVMIGQAKFIQISIMDDKEELFIAKYVDELFELQNIFQKQYAFHLEQLDK